MDKFNSAVFYREMLVDADQRYITDLDYDLYGSDGDPPPELDVNTEAWGWWDGGLARIMADLPNRGTLYFRGHALFDNPDDAKNDYLMNPEVERVDQVAFAAGAFAPEPSHVPWGMVIPHWHDTLRREGFGEGQRYELRAVTIILFWQEQS
jgi:hypothetical protein